MQSNNYIKNNMSQVLRIVNKGSYLETNCFPPNLLTYSTNCKNLNILIRKNRRAMSDIMFLFKRLNILFVSPHIISKIVLHGPSGLLRNKLSLDPFEQLLLLLPASTHVLEINNENLWYKTTKYAWCEEIHIVNVTTAFSRRYSLYVFRSV